MLHPIESQRLASLVPESKPKFASLLAPHYTSQSSASS